MSTFHLLTIIFYNITNVNCAIMHILTASVPYQCSAFLLPCTYGLPTCVSFSLVALTENTLILCLFLYVCKSSLCHLYPDDKHPRSSSQGSYIHTHFRKILFLILYFLKILTFDTGIRLLLFHFCIPEASWLCSPVLV